MKNSNNGFRAFLYKSLKKTTSENDNIIEDQFQNIESPEAMDDDNIDQKCQEDSDFPEPGIPNSYSTDLTFAPVTKIVHNQGPHLINRVNTMTTTVGPARTNATYEEEAIPIPGNINDPDIVAMLLGHGFVA